MNTTANVRNRLLELLAARRTLFCAAIVLCAIPMMLGMLLAGSAHALLVLALPILPVVLLMMIAAGVLDAAVRDAVCEQDCAVDLPRPLQCRG